MRDYRNSNGGYDWGAIAISLLVGGAVAFLTAIIEGLDEIFINHYNNLAGGAVSAVTYLLSRHV